MKKALKFFVIVAIFLGFVLRVFNFNSKLANGAGEEWSWWYDSAAAKCPTQYGDCYKILPKK